MISVHTFRVYKSSGIAETGNNFHILDLGLDSNLRSIGPSICNSKNNIHILNNAAFMDANEM